MPCHDRRARRCRSEAAQSSCLRSQRQRSRTHIALRYAFSTEKTNVLSQSPLALHMFGTASRTYAENQNASHAAVTREPSISFAMQVVYFLLGLLRSAMAPEQSVASAHALNSAAPLAERTGTAVLFCEHTSLRRSIGSSTPEIVAPAGEKCLRAGHRLS